MLHLRYPVEQKKQGNYPFDGDGDANLKSAGTFRNEDIS
jgi:hypothetical protein